MRSVEEMYNLIMDIANTDNRILAVYMNGSRTNKNVPEDIFQDYDIVFVVKETKNGFIILEIFYICSILMKTHIIQVIRKIVMAG